MNYIKSFKEYTVALNENQKALPKLAAQLGKKLKLDWIEDHIPGNFYLDIDADFEVLWNSSRQHGNIGFQISDDSGNLFYGGTDVELAIDAIKRQL